MTWGQQLKVSVYDITQDKFNIHSLEDYMIQILAYEIPENFHIEVLKAYAIMIRTYILRKIRLYNGQGCLRHPPADLCNDGKHCLGACPIEDIKDHRKEELAHAVLESRDRILTYQGKLILPYYHNTCGGATENSEKVLGNTIQYARKVLCDYCRSHSPHWQSSIEFSLEELEEKLNIHFPQLSPMEGAVIDGFFYDAQRDEEGRILSLNIGDGQIKGREIQKRLGLYSNRFGWQPTGIRFFVQGKGHGLGLCKYGAQGLALQGKNSEEILKYYFTGIHVENMGQWSIKNPLQGKIMLIDPGHGGKDEGLQLNSWVEKEMNLKLSLILEKKIREAGADIHMTRRADEYMTLGERAERSNRLQPDFLLSIHGNDNPAMGSISQIYVYPGDIEAKRLGDCIFKEWKKLTIPSRKPTEADLYLIRESKKSTLILDIGYFFIRDQEALGKIAEGIYQGLLSYWGIHRMYQTMT